MAPGTKVIGGEEQPRGGREKPWWRGAVIAAGGFVLLLGMAVWLNGSGDPVEAPPSYGAEGEAGDADGVGGDPGTSARRTVDGVPVGYAHSEAGAVQAAVNYQVARSSAAYFTDLDVRHRVISAMATAEARGALMRNDDAAVEQVLGSFGIAEGSGNALVARAAPLGTKVDSCSGQVATVAVWMAGLIGTVDENAPLPVSASWSTYTLTLQWQDGDWKLASVSSAPGPTPLETGGQVPSSVEEFRHADEEFDAPPYVG